MSNGWVIIINLILIDRSYPIILFMIHNTKEINGIQYDLSRWIMWMNNNESISKTNQIHTTESIGWFNSLSILINGTGLKRWIDSFRYSYSSALEISYPWSSDIEEHSIPSKCRNVEERLILLLTTTIYYQTHPIWFIIILINPWIVTHWLTIEQMIDW